MRREHARDRVEAPASSPALWLRPTPCAASVAAWRRRSGVARGGSGRRLRGEGLEPERRALSELGDELLLLLLLPLCRGSSAGVGVEGE